MIQGGFTMLASKLGLASLPSGMTKRHISIVGMLGGIGFTMCLLLTEVSMPASLQTIPKLAVLLSSGLAATVQRLARPAQSAGSVLCATVWLVALVITRERRRRRFVYPPATARPRSALTVSSLRKRRLHQRRSESEQRR